MNELKQRHGCLSAWLVLMIFLNSLTALIYLFGSAFFNKALPSAPAWAFPVMALGAIVNVVCAVSLFRWKKWGFHGFVATSIVAFAMNLVVGASAATALFGLTGIAVLYGVLKIGGDKNGWSQLE